MFQSFLSFLSVLLAASSALAQPVLMTSPLPQENLVQHWSGFAISDTIILTVAHAETETATVIFGTSVVPGVRIKADRGRDIAAYRIKEPLRGLRVMKVAAQCVKQGLFQISGFAGIDAKTVKYPLSGLRVWHPARPAEPLLSLSGRAWMGMSGSPVIDENGLVVGIQSAGTPDQTTCVSLEQIKVFLKDVK